MNNLKIEEEFYEPDYDLDEIHDDSHLFEDYIEGEYDEEELERRKNAYSELKKTDKIFNNSYNLGIDSSEDDEPHKKSQVSEIKISSSSPDYHLYDSEKYSEYVDLSIIQRDINSFIDSNAKAQAILGNEPEKKKFTKPEINELFEIIMAGLTKGLESNVFVSPIYVLDVISTIINVDYKKLFDMLNYENKEILLIELNLKFKFLDGASKNVKIF